MEARIAHCHSHQTQHNMDAVTHGIFPAEMPEIVAALDPGIDHIEQVAGAEQPEEPLPAGIKIIFVAVIILQIVGIQQGTDHVIHNDIKDNKKVLGKQPVLYIDQVKLPPPEMDEQQEYIAGPEQVHAIGGITPRMLHQLYSAVEQMPDAEAQQDTEDNFDMGIRVHRFACLYTQNKQTTDDMHSPDTENPACCQTGTLLLLFIFYQILRPNASALAAASS